MGIDYTGSKWICSDPDCSQYCLKESDYIYRLIEIREYPDENTPYVVCYGIIDLSDYELDELESFCEGYYDSLTEVFDTYGTDAMQIIAECVFEQTQGSELNFGALQHSLAEANHNSLHRRTPAHRAHRLRDR